MAEKKSNLTKVLAILGTVLVFLPLLMPVLLSILGVISSGEFNFDFLMPAELFPVALAGGIQLIWASIRARKQRVLICVGFVAAVLLLIAGQEYAAAYGMTTGVAEPSPLSMSLVMGSIAGYSSGLVASGVGGILLLRNLFKPDEPLV